MSSSIAQNLLDIQKRIAAFPNAQLVAVSKTKPAELLREAFAAGQRIFGENYAQEALAKQQALLDLPIEWHFIGPLQSNKAELIARHFDWLHSLDRSKLIPLLAAARLKSKTPLNVLIQVNVDDEASKSGCKLSEIEGLAMEIAQSSSLTLRGLMCIPNPDADQAALGASFDVMRRVFLDLRTRFTSFDTLSMGMSGDLELALQHGSNMIRVGSAIFGART